MTREQKKLMGLYKQRENLTRLIEAQMSKAFPVGQQVEWMHGNFWQSGHVESAPFNENVFVRNHRTYKTIRLSLWYLLIHGRPNF